jgi:UDPglucose 6-dehydrogenase
MVNISVIGTGYVGLVSAAAFASYGHNVICVDNDKTKIDKIKLGVMPIFEKNLESVVREAVAKDARDGGNMSFTTDLASAVINSDVSIIAVGTPVTKSGSLDLKYVLEVAEGIGEVLRQSDKYQLIVTKSTVPPMTFRKVEDAVRKGLRESSTEARFGVASNPEFLKEGKAWKDASEPDRVIIGVQNERDERLLTQIYAPFQLRSDRLIVASPVEAELIKFAANAMLATRIAAVNTIARLCDYFGADVKNVREGLRTDPRIGEEFLYPGPGYGGSCLPKDVQGFVAIAKEVSKGEFGAELFQATHDANESQKQYFADKVVNISGGPEGIRGKSYAIWGTAFKAGTNDIRESSALKMIEELVKCGAIVRVHDPKAMDNTRKYLEAKGMTSSVEFFDRKYAATEGADALVIMTEWKEYRAPDLHELKMMSGKNIFDGRNCLIYDKETVRKHGFEYHGVGR